MKNKADPTPHENLKESNDPYKICEESSATQKALLSVEIIDDWFLIKCTTIFLGKVLKLYWFFNNV